MNSAFCATESFLVTGAPHASAYYPRDFAWFYPDVLDPDTIIDSGDAIRRVRLLERSVRLMLEAVRAGVVTTTIVPAGRRRYIGVDYFSRPSDTLLGILAGLEQIINADQKAPGSYLGLSQGAHAGRLLLIEYREDLKQAVIQLARSLEPFDDDGTGCLLCDATAPRSAATDTRAERRRFVTNACVYATFLRAMELGVIGIGELEQLLGRELSRYKAQLLGLFGKHGYLVHSWIAMANHLRPDRPRLRQCTTGILGLEGCGRTRLVRSHDRPDHRGTAVSRAVLFFFRGPRGNPAQRGATRERVHPIRGALFLRHLMSRSRRSCGVSPRVHRPRKTPPAPGGSSETHVRRPRSAGGITGGARAKGPKIVPVPLGGRWLSPMVSWSPVSGEPGIRDPVPDWT